MLLHILFSYNFIYVCQFLRMYLVVLATNIFKTFTINSFIEQYLLKIAGQTHDSDCSGISYKITSNLFLLLVLFFFSLSFLINIWESWIIDISKSLKIKRWTWMMCVAICYCVYAICSPAVFIHRLDSGFAGYTKKQPAQTINNNNNKMSIPYIEGYSCCWYTFMLHKVFNANHCCIWIIFLLTIFLHFDFSLTLLLFVCSFCYCFVSLKCLRERKKHISNAWAFHERISFFHFSVHLLILFTLRNVCACWCVYIWNSIDLFESKLHICVCLCVYCIFYK